MKARLVEVLRELQDTGRNLVYLITGLTIPMITIFLIKDTQAVANNDRWGIFGCICIGAAGGYWAYKFLMKWATNLTSKHKQARDERKAKKGIAKVS